jgi:hypothetical protein
MAASGFRVVGLDRNEALVHQARARPSAAELVRADLLSWRPSEPVDGVLCRGVPNDITAAGERRAAFGASASWLRPGGVLPADVRDREATAARHAPSRDTRRRSAGRDARFTSSATEPDSDRRLVHVRERYAGTVDGVAVDERHDFVMRCWTAQDVRRPRRRGRVRDARAPPWRGRRHRAGPVVRRRPQVGGRRGPTARATGSRAA